MAMDRRRVINNLCSHIGAPSQRLSTVLLNQANSAAVANYPSLKTSLTAMSATLASQINAMSLYVKDQDPEASLDLSQASYDAAFGDATGLVDQIDVETPVSKMCRDAYAGLSMIALGYHRLYTIAVGVADTTLQQLAIDHLEEIAPVMIGLSEQICSTYAEELHDADPTINPTTTASAAISGTQAAWAAS